MTEILTDACVVFDLDGTLVDTAPDLLDTLDHILALECCPPADRLAITPLISQGALAMIEHALKTSGKTCDSERLRELWAVYLARYEKNIAVASRPYPHTEAALETLRKRGARLGVCTNKSERLADKLLAELSMKDYFTAIVGVDTLDVKKPHPGHLLGTISAMGGTPARAVMVGDSETDIKTAQAANIPVIAVPFGYSAIPVETLKPDMLVDGHGELVAAVCKLLANSRRRG